MPGKLSGNQKNGKYFDYTLLFIVIVLIGFGLVMLYSVSSYEAQTTFGDPAFYVKKQLRSVMIGLALMIIAAMIPQKFIKKCALPVYVLVTIACVAVLFIGTSANNSQRWFSIGGVSVQPSEFAKLAVILFLAAVISYIPKGMARLRTIGILCLFLIPILIAVAAANLSTAIIIAGIAVVMMFVTSPKYAHIIFIVCIGIAFFAAFVALAGYRSTRIQAWLHPDLYTDETYQTIQGLYAIGSGGLLGKGLGSSIQKMGYVPEAQNDFIFSIICEELGLFGAIAVIALFVLLLWRCMIIASNAKNLFGSLLVVGIMAHIALQVILNIAVVTNTIPNTGITLPFISYGGTAILVLLFEIGIVMNVARSIRLRSMDAKPSGEFDAKRQSTQERPEEIYVYAKEANRSR